MARMGSYSLDCCKSANVKVPKDMDKPIEVPEVEFFMDQMTVLIILNSLKNIWIDYSLESKK